ncbi:Polyketide cyclase / dehydrase and lipid transport [Ruegeria halocynthiae]|uniref:Polyketide cyclase / dehydrase and lipid transport n=1 Tax=Ruegeria halocynthiae TaxID=985054 RepID=A0A1H2YXT7_9RHOB|nr:SRPBCC family protein [Ruegeria halocynthiae]SDX10002.1 Polyketide cyclase / dehydrase and lipid transport [Ruegeria halocynthiae]
MLHQERHLELEARPEDIWAILSRFMHIDDFAPQVVSVDALTVGTDGIGSKRRCHFANGTSLVEEVTDWQVNRGYTVRLSHMAMPLHEAQAAIAITPLSTSRSRVTWSMDFGMKYGPIGWLMGQTLLKVMIGRVLADNLSALAAKVRPDPDAQTQTA